MNTNSRDDRIRLRVRRQYGACLPAAAALLTLAAAPTLAITDVGNMSPGGGNSTPYDQGTALPLNVSVEVLSPGVTDSAGQGAGISCTLQISRGDSVVQSLAMAYNGDAGPRDRYSVPAGLSGLAAGNHTFTAWCSDDGGQSQVFASGDDGVIAIIPPGSPPPRGAGSVMVQLFEWKWTDIEQECAFLAAKGFDGIQVPPPSEHLNHLTTSGNPWWVRYQPMSYQLESRSGTRAEFASMVNTCGALGVDIYVDAVINHMTGAGFGAIGTAGTFYVFNSYTYPDVWVADDFHMCGVNAGTPFENDISDFGNRFEVQTCELLGLADLNTEDAAVQDGLRAYMQDLMDLGVAGFRVDAAKHMDSQSLGAMFDGLSPQPYVFQEVIDSFGEQVRAYEYFVHGRVAEFAYGDIVGAAFSNCGSSPATLQNLDASLFGTDYSVVFIDNHDTQRGGGCDLMHADGSRYDLANVFMLAYPYGHPRVMSSYWFGFSDQAPPNDGGATRNIYQNGEPVGCNASEWVCEHRRPAMANLVQLRQLAGDTPLSDWWDDGSNRIAFGRGDRGYVGINNTSSPITRTWQTSMAAGTYCNIARYDVSAAGTCVIAGTDAPAPSVELIAVDSGGEIAGLTLPGFTALAIHAEAMVTLADADLDGVGDDIDNCTELANVDQIDSDGDGIGNRCDPDLNNDGVVNFEDLSILKSVFFTAFADADFNGDGTVNFEDLAIMKDFFFGAPGPAPMPPQTCGVSSLLDPTEAFGDVMFLRGTAIGDWAATTGQNDFANIGGSIYALEAELGAGDFAYKVANGGWSIERTNVAETLVPGTTITLQDNGGGSPNALMSLPQPGCYRFELDATDTDEPTLSLELRF